MTTSSVAKRLRIGQPTISRIENGRHAILPRNVYHLLELYGGGTRPRRLAAEHR